ncbi:MAG: hypothetical protein R2799_04885 [Crocinitomicaceae bacterium]
MKFSERIGLREVKDTFQLESMDDELRSGLWNVFLIFYGNKMDQESRSVGGSKYKNFIETLWFSYFKSPMDTIPYSTIDTVIWLRKQFFSWEWFYVYDFIEFIVKNPDPANSNEMTEAFNFILKRELSGYRFIGLELTPISDENQIAEIQKALDSSNVNGLKGVYIHLHSSLEKLSDKKTPDYRNSIKESISAIESLVQIISGDKKAELGKALKLIKDKLGLHGALEQGFIKIYGYTSDGDGIRHALMEEPNLDLEDATYMLTSCSAFINYLVIKANKTGIELV